MNQNTPQERQYFIFTPAKTLERFNALLYTKKIEGVLSRSPVYDSSAPFVKINVTEMGNDNADDLYTCLKSASILTTRTWA